MCPPRPVNPACPTHTTLRPLHLMLAGTSMPPIPLPGGGNKSIFRLQKIKERNDRLAKQRKVAFERREKRQKIHETAGAGKGKGGDDGSGGSGACVPPSRQSSARTDLLTPSRFFVNPCAASCRK